MDLLAGRELELGPVEGLNHMLPILQLGVDGCYNLANVDSGRCALGLSKGTTHTWQFACQEGKTLKKQWPAPSPIRMSLDLTSPFLAPTSFLQLCLI